MKPKNVLSLFSGCGGMDLGFEGAFKVHKKSYPIALKNKANWIELPSTRFKTVFSNDILVPAQNAWINYFKGRHENAENIFHLESIVDLVMKYKAGEFKFPQNIDVVTGGFPCQDFSLAGKRKGFESHKNHNGIINDVPTETNRGKLYLWLREVVSIVKPKIFIAENVKGLASLGDVKQIIEDDFRNIDKGYFLLDAKILNAKDFGVPQNRERVIFIGISRRYVKKEVIADLEFNKERSKFNPYPTPTHGTKQRPYVILKDIFSDLSEPEDSDDPSHSAYSKAKYYGKMQGGTEIDINGQGPTIRAEHHGNIEFRRLSKEKGGKISSEYHLNERRLSVRECARIQTFPDDYQFVFKNEKYSINASDSYKVIGNAVPPLLAYSIASRLSNIWEELFND